MSEIKAFVGHSFADDDEAITRTFLNYFDQLSEVLPNFSWASAKPAEPKDLAEKVISLLSDKNVFIGICTKREYAFDPKSIAKTLLPSAYLKVPKTAVVWKTSDWLMQEIGLAKGRGLALILLVEIGIRPPGGLQGNVEYIEFDRASPERSFGKILEMIKALSPISPGALASPESGTTLAKAAEEVEKPNGDDDWLTPKPDWDRQNFKFGFWHATTIGDTNAANAISQEYLKSGDAARGDNKCGWDAYVEFAQLVLGKGGSLANLKKLADLNPGSSKALAYLARGFEEYGDYEAAANTNEAAASKTTDEAEMLRLLGVAAAQWARAERPSAASKIVDQMKNQFESKGTGELQLLKALIEVAKIANENTLALATMERVVELDPADNDTRFSLAYGHSGVGNNDLALFHYLKIPYHERNSTAWNNLGVAFDHFKMPAKSVGAYRRSEEMGETLAMSNLAQKLLSAGFLPEAEMQFNKAVAAPDRHPNVGDILAKLKSLPDEENQKQAELLKKAKPKSEFYREFGRAASRSEPSTIAERWEGPDCVLAVKLLGSSFSAEGSYERPSNALLGVLIGGGPLSSGGHRSSRINVKYSGNLRGRAIEAWVTRTEESAAAEQKSLLSAGDDVSNVLIFLSDDENELRAMENPTGGSPRFYTLKRQGESDAQRKS